MFNVHVRTQASVKWVDLSSVSFRCKSIKLQHHFAHLHCGGSCAFNTIIFSPCELIGLTRCDGIFEFIHRLPCEQQSSIYFPFISHTRRTKDYAMMMIFKPKMTSILWQMVSIRLYPINIVMGENNQFRWHDKFSRWLVRETSTYAAAYMRTPAHVPGPAIASHRRYRNHFAW